MTQDAFEDLVLPMRKQLQRIAYTFFGNREDAQDAVQDALLRLWRLRGQLPAEGAEAYAVRVVKNVCIDQWRRRKNVSLSLDEIDEPLHSETPYRRLAANEMQERLSQAVAQLPERHRLLLRMRQEEGLSPEEISRLTGIAPRSVSAMVSEARRKLWNMINSD